MKLAYLAPTGIFDDWAHTIQIMKMCEAFAENGLEVELIIPDRKSDIKSDPFEYYNVKKIFKITSIPFIDILKGNTTKIFYWTRLISFVFSSRFYLIFHKYDVIYSREIFIGLFFRNVFIERHSFSDTAKGFKVYALNRASGIIVLTSFIKERMVKSGIDSEKIMVAPDAVKLDDFRNILTIPEARKKLSLSGEDYFLGYIGTLKTMGMEKGVSTLIDSLKFLPVNFKAYVVGGEKTDVDFYKSYAKNNKLSDRVIFTGKVSHKEVPLHIAACDVVTAPFPANEHYSFFMSPLKIFEYMASHKPIIATDLPSLREVLEDRKDALLVPPDANALAEATLNLSNNQELAEKISENSYRKVLEKFTWNRRADKISSFISENCR